MDKPLDARLARALVAPWRHSALRPNHLTVLRLVVGLAGAAAFALEGAAHLGAALIVASNFLDHMDGELARMTRRSSRAGHYFDLTADAAVTVTLFIGVGIGVARTGGGSGAIWMGIAAGIAVAAIFQVRNKLEASFGKAATRQPRWGGFEAEDVMYALPLITLGNLLPEFLLAASIGAPLALAVVLLHARRIQSTRPA